MSRADFDWVSLWYIAARERGINDICTVARLDTKTGEIERHLFSHAQMDGVGALGQLLRDRGYPLTQLPQTKFVIAPPLRRRPMILWRALRAAGPQNVEWLDRDPDRQGDPHAMEYITFTQSETAKLRQLSQARGISINGFLLEAVNRTIVPDLVAGNARGKWVFPVNLRGAVNKTRDTANHSTAIALNVDRHTQAEDLDRQIRDGLKSGAHWAAWWILNIGRVIGLRGIRYLSQASEKNSHWLGTFSNMGEWNVEGPENSTPSTNEVWMAAPPGTKNYPISVACLTWNGKLTITLKIHSSIHPDPGVARRYLANLKTQLLGLG